VYFLKENQCPILSSWVDYFLPLPVYQNQVKRD